MNGFSSRTPDPDHLAAEPLLAALALLDHALLVVARAVRAAHPDLYKAHPTDAPTQNAARTLIDECHLATHVLDVYCDLAFDHLRARSQSWPY